MKFNIYFTLKGPGGTVEAPNYFNPVECANMASLLTILSAKLPYGLGAMVIGIRVEQVGDEDEPR